MKLITAFPLYHTVPSAFFTRYMGMNKPNVVGNIVIDAVYLPLAMEMIVKQALKIKDWDRLVILESDTIPPADAFERLENYDKIPDIVGAFYFGHSKPHAPMVYIQEDDTLLHNPLTPQTVKTWTDEPALYECSAVGFGFTSIARHVLEHWDKKIPMFYTDKKEIDFGSHDLWFCYQARKQGFKVYVDSGIVCEHLTEVPIGLKDNQSTTDMIKDAKIIEFGKSRKTVLSVGSGADRTVPDVFRDYVVKTLDIDPKVNPDIVADGRELSKIKDRFDGIFCSHNIEHYPEKDISKVLNGFYHVLNDGGRLDIRTPDVGAVRKRLASGISEAEVAYDSPVGPITYYDILHGHQASIKAGNTFMKHLTGFTKQSLTKALKTAGFSNINVRSNNLELRATAKKVSKS